MNTQSWLLAHVASQANDFSGLLGKYIEGLRTPKVKCSSELIAFNEEHRNLELPPGQYLQHPHALSGTNLGAEHPGQEKLAQSKEEANRLSEKDYKRLDMKTTAAGREHGIDKVLHEYNADIIIGPADGRIPDVTTLASTFLTLHGVKGFEIDILCRIPNCDTSAWVPRLEWHDIILI